MNGRLEKEIKAQEKMNKKLAILPEIFKSYYTYLRAAKKTYSTIDVYINNVIHFAKFVCGDSIRNDFYNGITPEIVESYLISLETTVKSGKVTRSGSDIQCARWSSLRTFWEFLVKRNYVKENVIDKTTRPKSTSDHTVTYLDKKEIKKLMSTIDKNPDKIISARDRTLIGLGIATGMRCSALVGINVSDINFEENYIQVIEKGNKSRNISIGEQTKEMLAEWIKVRNELFKTANTDALFISKKNNRLSTDAANDALKKYAEEASIKKHLTMHKLRASTATNAAAAGISIQAIANQLGHSSTVVTQRYISVLSEEKKKTVDVLDNLF